MNDLCDYKEVYIDRVDLKGAFIGYLEGDPPLLRDLGIDLHTIFTESRVVFEIFGRKTSSFNCKTADSVGPLFYSFLYSVFLMASGKVHFGYIYFLSLISNVFVYFIVNVLSESHINIFESYSIIGYAQIPMVLFAFCGIFLQSVSVPLKLVFGTFSALWSGGTASLIFVRFLNIEELFCIVLYPVFLVYFCFALIVVF